MAIWNEYNWKFWDKKLEPLPAKTTRTRPVSIITTCMNRLDTLKKTYVENIENNIDYPKVEFILVNYGSRDNLDGWVQKNLTGYIEKGIVKYVNVLDDIQYYDMSHSRNIGFKMASSSRSICQSVDADNYIGRTKTGDSFASLINRMGEIVGEEKTLYFRSKRLCHGRLGMRKDHFMWIGGYPEKLASGEIFSGYGWDDKCLTYRCGALGWKMMWFCQDIEVNRIKTTRKDKGINMENKNWKETEEINKNLTMKILDTREFRMHRSYHWGKAKVHINFDKVLDI